MTLQHVSCNSTACLHRGVLMSLAKDEKWNPGWAYDGRKSMYAPDMFLSQAETSYNVRCTCAACSWHFTLRCQSLTALICRVHQIHWCVQVMAEDQVCWQIISLSVLVLCSCFMNDEREIHHILIRQIQNRTCICCRAGSVPLK